MGMPKYEPLCPPDKKASAKALFGILSGAVALDAAREERLNALEEAMWLRRAQDAAAGGYLSPEESDAFMQSRLARATSK